MTPERNADYLARKADLQRKMDRIFTGITVGGMFLILFAAAAVKVWERHSQ